MRRHRMRRPRRTIGTLISLTSDQKGVAKWVYFFKAFSNCSRTMHCPRRRTASRKFIGGGIISPLRPVLSVSAVSPRSGCPPCSRRPPAPIRARMGMGRSTTTISAPDRKRDPCRPDMDHGSSCNDAAPFCARTVSIFTWTWWNIRGSAT